MRTFIYSFPFFSILLFPLLLLGQQQTSYPPEGFVYLKEAIPDVSLEVRYAGTHNFMGRPVEGYENPRILMTEAAAIALKKVQDDVKQEGFRLKVFDAYRPQRAVNHFIKWARDEEDTLMKTEFYPEVDKKDLFKSGYIAEKSGHTRGSTVDLTLVEASTGKELDMGSPYDFFGPISHHGSQQVTETQEANREILKEAMLRHGFKALPEEWWHYSLREEPFPDTYFDFPVR